LYAWRSGHMISASRFAWNSRESGLLLNNVFLLVTAATVLLGTLYPLFLDALGLGKISVGSAYFETIFVPLMTPVLLLMAIGPYLPWKQASLTKIFTQLRWPLVILVVLVSLSQFVLAYSWGVTFGLLLAAWILSSTVQHLLKRLFFSALPANFGQRLQQQPRSYWGMLLAHSGIAIFIVGVTLVKGWEISQDISLEPGSRTQLGTYTYTFDDLKRVQGPNYIAARARFIVTQGEQQVAVMYPERRIYTSQNMPMTEAAIDRSLTRDLYISLGEADRDNRWVLKIQQKPFIGWIWAGCLLIGFGGLLAATDLRYRTVRNVNKKSIKNTSVHGNEITQTGQPALASEVYSSCNCRLKRTT